MREPRNGQEQQANYLVLSRSCGDLYAEIAALFADRPDIKVVVDRRRGPGEMPEIPARGSTEIERRQARRTLNLTLVLSESRVGSSRG
jgi:hypothetical protein